jgi:hypothetical protein
MYFVRDAIVLQSATILPNGDCNARKSSLDEESENDASRCLQTIYVSVPLSLGLMKVKVKRFEDLFKKKVTAESFVNKNPSLSGE